MPRMPRHQRVNCMVEYSDAEFLRKFRIPKEEAQNLARKYNANLKSNTMRNNALTPLEKVCISLRFYASGAFLSVSKSGMHNASYCHGIKCCFSVHRASFYVFSHCFINSESMN